MPGKYFFTSLAIVISVVYFNIFSMAPRDDIDFDAMDDEPLSSFDSVEFERVKRSKKRLHAYDTQLAPTLVARQRAELANAKKWRGIWEEMYSRGADPGEIMKKRIDFWGS